MNIKQQTLSLQLHRTKESTQDNKLCNYRQKKKKKNNSCPLDDKCLTKCVVYEATVTETTSNNEATYIGLTENEFKTRLNLHKSSFKLEHKRTSTALSDPVWKLKNKNINFNIKWEVVKKWSHSHQVIKCANFAYKKNYPSLGVHHIWIKQCWDIVCIRNDSCLAIRTIHCQPMRSPL